MTKEEQYQAPDHKLGHYPGKPEALGEIAPDNGPVAYLKSIA